MPYLIDSDILIDISRAIPQAIEYIDSLPGDWMISQVTAMELIVGARGKQELADLDVFISSNSIVPLSDQIGAKGYELLKSSSKSHGLHVFDSLIAATAILEDLTLLTRNKKHFHMIDKLSVEFPGY
jgi:tRNA(fMet)-specific endonuclease VapC